MTIQVRYTRKDGTVTNWLDYDDAYGGMVTVDTNANKAVEWQPKPEPCTTISSFMVDGARVRCELTHPDPSLSPLYHTYDYEVDVDGGYCTGLVPLSWYA